MSTKIVVAVQMLCISWLSLQQLSAGQTMRCRRNRLLSDDTALLSPAHITAFRDSIPIPPLKDIVSNFWCANSGTGNYVNMTFSQPVVLEGILSSGATSNNNRVRHYVSDFAIFYSNTVNGPLRLYSAENFTATSQLAKYTLIDSLAGLKFQFRINKFQTDAFFCWTLRIFGCTLNSELPSSTQQTSTASSPAMPSSDTEGQQSSQAVAGAIAGGGSVVLVVGVVMIVSAITLCIVTLAYTRRKRQSMEVKSDRLSTVQKVENVALYTTTISSDEKER